MTDHSPDDSKRPTLPRGQASTNAPEDEEGTAREHPVELASQMINMLEGSPNHDTQKQSVHLIANAEATIVALLRNHAALHATIQSIASLDPSTESLTLDRAEQILEQCLAELENNPDADMSFRGWAIKQIALGRPIADANLGPIEIGDS